jgi:hypothetical protein
MSGDVSDKIAAPNGGSVSVLPDPPSHSVCVPVMSLWVSLRRVLHGWLP